MQTVLLSIHEKWWNLIKEGKKTLEIRKTVPKNITFPFKVVCYVTGGKGIQGTFICKSILRLHYEMIKSNDAASRSCLSISELEGYSKGKELKAWCVSEVNIYESPMKLSDIGINRAPQSWCYLKDNQS